ncbi:MAG: alpha/beta hydrolase fold domain-containing protein [Planctomycetaceae bacterium]|nr:alpha/beta hydrolase fold domain-containing protein [Planctomycetaceae bacterium]
MKRIFTIAALFILHLLVCPSASAAETVRVVMAGDSTMSTYEKPRDDRPDLAGWGQVLDGFFGENVEVVNLAASGRSLPSFRAENRWAKVLESQPDFVFIQFGHNDQKIASADGDPATGYSENLRQYVRDVQNLNAVPVLITPVARRTFEDGVLTTSLTPFADAVKAVAAELKVPVIDLHELSFRVCRELREDGCWWFAPSDTDRTHFSLRGATAIAALVADQLPATVPQLAAHLLPTAQRPALPNTLAQSYKSVDDRHLKITFWLPPDWTAADRRPAMVFYHGGGWTGGTPTQFTRHCEHLADRGLVCGQVQYRLLDRKTQDPPTICIHDAKSAMRWVRSHSRRLGIDAERIGAGGGSAGGHLAAFVGMVNGTDDPGDDTTVSAKANALTLFNPVFDNGPDNGWGQQRVGDRYQEFSPAHNISADDPPMIVFLGTEDKLIPVSVVQRFEAGMKTAGVRCDVHLYEGQGHGFFNPGRGGTDEYFQQTLQATDAFLTSLAWLPEPAGGK